MGLIIKCGSESLTVAGYPTITVCSFTVRLNHCIVHRDTYILHEGNAPPSVADARLAAVRQALHWLEPHARPGRTVVIRWSPPLPPPDSETEDLLHGLTDADCAIDLQPVSEEFVSETKALAVTVALARLQQLGWSGVTPGATTRRRTPAKATKPRRPENRDRDLDAATLIFCDGGYKPGPGAGGVAVYGFLVWQQGRLVHRDRGVVCRGRSANCQIAELGAVVAALRWLIASTLAADGRVEIRSDCQWVIDVLTGRPGPGHIPGTTQLRQVADRLLTRLRGTGCQTTLLHAPRRQVAEADALCREVYRESTVRQSLSEFLRLKPQPVYLVQSGR